MSDEIEARNRMTHPLLREEQYQLTTAENLTVETEEGEKTYRFSVYKAPGDKDQPLEELSIAHTKEDNLYLVAMANFDEETFDEKFKSAKAKFDFNSFVEKLALVVSNVNTNRTVYSATFNENKLTFKQKLQFKTVKLF